jgi:hypothetical protein
MAQHIVFVCLECDGPGEVLLEDGDELIWEARGTRICVECLERMCGLVEGVSRPGESSE